MGRRRKERYRVSIYASISMIIMAMIILVAIGSIMILTSAGNVASKKAESRIAVEDVLQARENQEGSIAKEGQVVAVEGEVIAWGKGKAQYEEMKNQAQEDEKKMQEVVSGDYVLPNSGTAKLTEADLKGLSKEQLRIARNEIMARHGRRFGNGDLQAYFESKSWYKGKYTGEEFDEVAGKLLSPIEQDNIDFILSHE